MLLSDPRRPLRSYHLETNIGNIGIIALGIRVACRLSDVNYHPSLTKLPPHSVTLSEKKLSIFSIIGFSYKHPKKSQKYKNVSERSEIRNQETNCLKNASKTLELSLKKFLNLEVTLTKPRFSIKFLNLGCSINLKLMMMRTCGALKYLFTNSTAQINLPLNFRTSKALSGPEI